MTKSLWNQVEATDPKYTKAFDRTGGFKGTAFNPQYMWKRATEIFGECGKGWGYKIVDEKYVPGHMMFGQGGEQLGEQCIHVVRVKFWYKLDGKKHKIEHFGQTTFIGKNKYGPFTDEEAPKKSLTDALMKCMSMLGFGADVYLGLYDDNKYVDEVAKAKARETYTKLADEIRSLATADAMSVWSEENKIAVMNLPREWVEELRAEYQKHADSLNGSAKPDSGADDFLARGDKADAFEREADTERAMNE